MPPPDVVEYRLTAALAARAVDEYIRARRRDLARKFRKPFGSLLLYAAFCGAILLAGHLTGADALFLTVATALAAVAGGLVALMLAAQCLGQLGFSVLRRRAAGIIPEAYTAAPAPTVRWTFTDDGFETRLEGNARAVSWAAVRSLLATPGFWVIGVTDGPDLFLPLDVLSDEVRARVRAKLGATASAG